MLKVSVIVPVFNVESYLEKCLESLVSQDYENFEIICVDDGSKDRSLDILNAYSKKYSFVKVLTKSNGGLSDARNFGVAHSTGDYFLFVDSDDYVASDYISKMVQPVLIDPEIEIVVCDMKYDYGDHFAFSSGGEFHKDNIKTNPDLLAINNSACNKLIKKNLVIGHPFPIGVWYEDLATIPTMILDAKSIYKIDEPLYFYVQREGSIVHTKNMKIFDIYKALETINESIENHSKKAKKILNRLYILHGADITSQRIRFYNDERENYLKKNQNFMKQHDRFWIFNPFILSFPFKKIVLLILFYLGFHSFLLKLLDAKG